MMPVEDRFTAPTIKAATELALLEMISTGTTSFSDMYFFCDTTIRSCLEAGIKANIARPIQCFDPTETYASSARAAEA